MSSDMLDGRTFESTDVSGETLVDGTNVTVSFDGDGISANAGCNTMNGTYEVADGVLTVGPLAQTQMACEDALQQQDVWVATLLEGEPTVTLVDDTLTIASDSTTVTFQKLLSAGPPGPAGAARRRPPCRPPRRARSSADARIG